MARKTLAVFLSDYGIVIALVGIGVALSLANANFLTVSNLANVLRQISINGILATGMTFVILTGGIDLSIGSVMAFAGMIGASIASGDAPGPAALATLAAMGTGAILGACNGALVAWARVPAFVATLGMLSAARGLTLIYSDGMPISQLSEGLKAIGQGAIAGIPAPVAILACVAAISWVVLQTTVYGRRIYAVGGNVRSARTSGIRTGAVLFSVYVLMGGLAGLAGVVLAARSTAALPQAGVAYELDAIAAVVIGGTSLTGGVGNVALTLVGVLIIGLINNGLDLLNVSSYYQQLVKGVIIVAAVMIDRARHYEPV